jgi:16S rRNA (guanine(966)-N(2))-methyltransferase RsmD
LRPTADRVKEALFNILPNDLSGVNVLDLFAGTGNLAVEALSRGAREVLLVDDSHEAGRAIHENLHALGFSQKSRVWIKPFLTSTRLLARSGEKFDLIFADPPYDKGWVVQVLTTIAQTGLLRESGLLIAEHSGREEVKEWYGCLKLQDQRRYGSTRLSFFGYPEMQLIQQGKRRQWRNPA